MAIWQQRKIRTAFLSPAVIHVFLPLMPESQQQSRGRSVVSKPLNPHPASSKSKSVPSAAAKRERSSQKTALERTQSTRPIATSSKSITKTNSSAKLPEQTPSQETGDNNFKVTKLSSTTVKLSSTSWTPPPPPAKVPQPQARLQESSPATDSLHLAAQAYSWTYMSSTLDACFKSAEKAAINDIETRKEELSAEETEMSEQRQRLDAQRAIELYDELGSELFVKEAPAIMQQFHTHGDSCANIETEALNLAASGKPKADDEEPLKAYNQMLDDLDELQHEATGLQNLIANLTERALATPDKTQKDHEGGDGNVSDDPEANTARQQIISVFAACLPVLKARIANLSMAQDLVDSALENATLSLRMESMGIAD